MRLASLRSPDGHVLPLNEFMLMIRAATPVVANVPEPIRNKGSSLMGVTVVPKFATGHLGLLKHSV